MAFFKDFTGRVAFVTGAGKGIGRAIAQRFYDGNADGVVIADYDIALAEKTAKEIDPSGKKVIAIKCDVSCQADVDAAVAQTYTTFGTIHILVNNAGIFKDAMLHKMTEEQWHSVMNVCLNSTFYTCRAVINRMRDQEYGRIVNIASGAAFGNAGQCNYAAAKSGMIGFTRCLGREGISKNITANVIAPGAVDTDLLRQTPDAVLQKALAMSPARRAGSPDELAAAVAFLCTEDASYISGQTLSVNGALLTI